jgi:hypothetical protein
VTVQCIQSKAVKQATAFLIVQQRTNNVPNFSNKQKQQRRDHWAELPPANKDDGLDMHPEA